MHSEMIDKNIKTKNNNNNILNYRFIWKIILCGLLAIGIPTSADDQKMRKSFVNATSFNKSVVSEGSPHCVQKACKFKCFNSKSADIEASLTALSEQNNSHCSNIEELRLYNYKSPDNVLSSGFLGNYTDKVDAIHIIRSKITDIRAGAFASGRFKRIYLENLQLKELKKDFFHGVSNELNDLRIIQKKMSLQSVHTDFLFHLKFQIKYLTIKAGLKSVRNMTGGDISLTNLTHARFSDNNFGNNLLPITFSKLSAIEFLDLQHSNLASLPTNIFAYLISTLNYLNLSYNKLKTISSVNVFGCATISRDLRVYAEGNQWLCSCDLQHEMKSMFFYSQHLFCSAPEIYKGLSVFDAKICEEKPNRSETNAIYDYERTTEASATLHSPYIGSNFNLMKLQCFASAGNKRDHVTHLTRWPFVLFTVTPKENVQVDVVVLSSTKSYAHLSLIWFSRFTTDYYKMEINYNEYGLGCYNVISFATTVRNLIPNTAYTFCLVQKQQLSTISPFNCKSVHVSNNLAITNTAWLTQDMRVAALSLVIFGTVLFFIAGILMNYLYLKNNDILVKRSKRVMKRTHTTGCHIKVMPKKKESNECSTNRRKSMDSEISDYSYMTTNLYEDITVYRNHHNAGLSVSLNSNPMEGKMDKQNADNSYLIPLGEVPSSGNPIKYAEIPYRAKSDWDDTPPLTSADQPPLTNRSGDFA